MKAVLALLLVMLMSANAQAGPATTIDNLRWNVVTSGAYKDFPILRLDVSGNLQASTVFLAAGTLGASSGIPFPVSGSGNVLGSAIYIALSQSTISSWNCVISLSSLNGSCLIYYFNGSASESASLTLAP